MIKSDLILILIKDRDSHKAKEIPGYLEIASYSKLRDYHIHTLISGTKLLFKDGNERYIEISN